MTPERRAMNVISAAKWNKEHYNISRLHNILNSCRVRAIKKGIEFTLTSQWFRHKAIDIGVCEDTGIPFNHDAPTIKKRNNPFSPSIDRRDPNKGYTEDNCKVVVWIHNRAKGDDDLEVLYYYCKEVVRAIEG